MHFLRITVAFIALLIAIRVQPYKFGNAIVNNLCSYPIYLWSIDEAHDLTDSEYTLVPSKSSYSEKLRVPRPGCKCGTSIKLSATPFITNITQFEYSYLYYDVSFVNCATLISNSPERRVFSGANCPGWDNGIVINGTGVGCQTMKCNAKEYCPYDAYFEPVPGVYQPVRSCSGESSTDLSLLLCVDMPNT